MQKAYDWALWIIPKVEKFPKSYRFSIGQSLVTASIELLMNLVDATYQARNAGSLASAVREVNRIRYLVRLGKDLRVINLAGHEFAAKAMDEIGRMTGGWLLKARGKSMKRTGNLWTKLTSWENMMEAARTAARGKRKRPDVARFLYELENNLFSASSCCCHIDSQCNGQEPVCADLVLNTPHDHARVRRADIASVPS